MSLIALSHYQTRKPASNDNKAWQQEQNYSRCPDNDDTVFIGPIHFHSKPEQPHKNQPYVNYKKTVLSIFFCNKLSLTVS
jgi:hypothetical protein